MSRVMNPFRNVATGIASALLATGLGMCLRAGTKAIHRPARFESLPGSLSREQIPQFVCFGSDDNGYSGMDGSGAGGGLHFFTQIFDLEKNPMGSGNPRTFDGQPAHYSFYVNTIMIDPPGDRPAIYGGGYSWEDPLYVKRAWKEALAHGHEIGAHTHSHPHGAAFSVCQWEEEMQRCIQFLGGSGDLSASSDRPDSQKGLGLKRNEILGFRTPYLECNDATLEAAEQLGFRYDCSLEESPISSDGKQFAWPRKLDQGGTSNNVRKVGRHPNLWEIPVYSFLIPPDDQCDRYGIPSGFRNRLKQIENSFDARKGEVTGMDWNLWLEYSMTPAEFLATLKYTFDQHLAGNRAPMTVGLHSHLYTEKYLRKEFKCTVQERQDALKVFLHYVLQHPQARVVSGRELLQWMERPEPIRKK